jgi:LmbE family N-acetylglucosaminyl deacetylase
VAGRDGLLARLPWRKPKRPAEELGKDGPLTAMVIVAHPDDAEFMCGGTVAKWCAQGWTVYYVLATSGDKGTHDTALTHQALAALREQEQRDACRVLGVKEVLFLGHPDGFLRADADLRGEVVRLLRQYRPDVVITWDGFRAGFNHNDHRAIGIAVRDAVYPAVRDHLYYAEHADEGLAAHQVNELLLAGTDDADYWVDIGDHMETKLEAVICHRSQIGGRTPEEMRKVWTERMRAQRRSSMVESFKRVSIRRPMRQEQPKEEQGQGQASQDGAAAPPTAGTPHAERSEAPGPVS